MDTADEIAICARVSELVYGPRDGSDDRRFCESSMMQLGFRKFSWISMESTFTEISAVAATSDNFHLLAFRGTKVVKDWMSDLASTPVRFEWVFPNAPALGQIHAGFGHCLAGGMKEIQGAMLLMAHSEPTKPLLITGHSLGGALAALAGAYFTVSGVPVPNISRIYTFGQPRIGLHDFCNTYGRILSGKLIRFVNKKDLVPRVPLRSFDYSDHGMMIHFNSSGSPEVESPEWKAFLVRAIQSFEEIAEIITHLRPDVGDHSMTEYKQLVEANKTKLGDLVKP